jgi:branched-chain amino acid transport system ATP-binding protein
VLRVEAVDVFYGHIQALRKVTLSVSIGQLVALLGPNGAGKTTLLRVISCLIPIQSGMILLNEKQISGLAPQEVVRLGVVHVPEGRQLIAPMTVKDNLMLGAYLLYRGGLKSEAKQNLTHVYQTFPILSERQQQLSGTLSGGEQQMLAIGRALMLAPKLLLLDEPSLGLAPLLVREIFEVLPKLQRGGTTVLLVEQNVRMALEIADYAYVLGSGCILTEGTPMALSTEDQIQQIYLGGSRLME